MSELKVAIADGFLDAYADIPRAQQKGVRNFMTKFRANPRASGINYETINNVKNKYLRSVRIDQNYRGIILAPEKGNVYVLLWVDKHDDAYDWAQKHNCSINPETGSLQVMQTTEGETTSAPQPSSPESPPIIQARPRNLLKLGVPEEQVDSVLAVTSEAELKALKAYLPVEAYEALLFLADGLTLDEVLSTYTLPDEPVDTEDYAAALARASSRRAFRIVEDELELKAMLEAPLEKWRVFLHPSQLTLVEKSWNGPVRVLGGAGTGKTVVAMHRARHEAQALLAAGTSQKVLFTTYTANLATDIESNLRKICNTRELERIEVINIDAWLHQAIKKIGMDFKVVYNDQQDAGMREAWEAAMAEESSELAFPEDFYRDEWAEIVVPNRISDQTSYLTVPRTGRGTRVNRLQRVEVWKVFEEYINQLKRRRLKTVEQAALDLCDLIDKGTFKPSYGAVVVDEAQDMGVEFMTLIGKLPGVGLGEKQHLFIVGDAHQRIYGRRFSLSKCDIDIRGRGRRLKINYRTTDETRRFAVQLLTGEVDDLDGGKDDLKGYRSLSSGEPPLVKKFSSLEEESAWIIEEIKALQAQGGNLREIVITAANNRLVGVYQDLIGKSGLSTQVVTARKSEHDLPEGIRMATIHRVKGLEFRYVFMAGMSDNAFSWVDKDFADKAAARSAENQCRSLLHVAATRAQKQLFVSTSTGKLAKWFQTILPSDM